MSGKFGEHIVIICILLMLCNKLISLKVLSISIDNTKRSSHLDFSSNHKHSDISDGCGISDDVEALWLPYSSKDLDYMNSILFCVRAINKIRRLGQSFNRNEVNYRDKFNLTYLKCNTPPATWDILLSNYDNIYMIGDSVLRQQYDALLCMMYPQLAANPRRSIKFITTKGYYQYHAVIPRPKSASRDNLPPLNIVYTSWGYTFPEPFSTWPLLREFPILLRHGTHRDLIILNAGHHYRSPDAGVLLNHTQTIINIIQSAHQQANAERSNRTLPHIYIMETSDENFPTSNGIYPGKECVDNTCTCRALSLDMQLGQGLLDPAINWTGSFGRYIPDHSILWNVTINFNLSQTWNYTRLVMDTGACIPDCYPADWRRRLTLPLLLDANASKYLNVVPTWRQLVSRGIPSDVSPGDCTHKGVDVIIEFNRQLFRLVERDHSYTGIQK
jgi:hypothetical protein